MNLNSFQPETVITSPTSEGFCYGMPTEPGIAVTRAYGFDTTSHFYLHPHALTFDLLSHSLVTHTSRPLTFSKPSKLA